MLLGTDLRELGSGLGQEAAGVIDPEQSPTAGQHDREVLAGATGGVQHPAVGRQPGEEPLYEAVVHRFDLAPLGVEVAGQVVLLSLVDPPEVPKPNLSLSRGRGADIIAAHVMVNLLRWRLLFLSVLHLRANRLQCGERGG
jgi:hypothetical protein